MERNARQQHERCSRTAHVHRTSEGILRLDPWHAAQNQPWDTYFANVNYEDLNASNIIARSPKEYNWWNEGTHVSSGGASWDYLYVLQRELPTNFEFSFTFVRNGSWGGLGLVLGKDPKHLPWSTEYYYRSGNSNDGPNNDFFPIAQEDQPAAIAFFQNPQATQTYPSNYNTISRWKNKGFLRPLFVANGLPDGTYNQSTRTVTGGGNNTAFTNKGWNPNIVLQDRAVANGTYDSHDFDSARNGYGQAWPYLYSQKAGVPYRITMARVNGVIILTVQEIGPNADPANWIRYRSDVKAANGVLKSSGDSPTLPLSASTLPAEAGQRLYFWCQQATSNNAYSAAGQTHNYESGEDGAPQMDEATFGGAIDDVVLRTVATEADLTPAPTAVVPNITAEPIASRGAAVSSQSNISSTPTNVTYVTYRLTNNTAQTAKNIQFYAEGTRYVPSGSAQARVPITAFDQNGDLPLDVKPTPTKDTLANVIYDTRPWSLGKNTGNIGNENAVVVAYVAELAAGASRDVTIAFVLQPESFDLPANAKVYLTVGAQNTRVQTLSNDYPAVENPRQVTNLTAYLTPGAVPPNKPASGYDGVTSPYGYYDWEYVDGSWVKIPFVFPPEPAAQAGGHWEPYIEFQQGTDPRRESNYIGSSIWKEIPLILTTNNRYDFPDAREPLQYRGLWRFITDPGTDPTPGATPEKPPITSNKPTKFGKTGIFKNKKLTFVVRDPDGVKSVTVTIGKKTVKAKLVRGKYVAKIAAKPKKVVVTVVDKKAKSPKRG